MDYFVTGQRARAARARGTRRWLRMVAIRVPTRSGSASLCRVMRSGARLCEAMEQPALAARYADARARRRMCGSWTSARRLDPHPGRSRARRRAAAPRCCGIQESEFDRSRQRRALCGNANFTVMSPTASNARYRSSAPRGGCRPPLASIDRARPTSGRAQ